MEKGAAARVIRKMAEQYEPMIEAAEALETIGNLETTTKEFERKRDAAIEQAAKAQTNLDLLKAQAEEVIGDANTTRSNADDYAAAVKAEAEASAKRITDEAQRNGIAVTGQAKSEAERIRGSARQHLGQMEAEVENKKLELAAIVKEISERGGELTAINERLEKARQLVAGGLQPV